MPKQVLNDAQLERFMTAIQEDKVWHDFFYTELTTGLRRGEICGLMWQDFDEAHGTLIIRRTIHAERGGRLTAGETKTGAGKRIITLPPVRPSSYRSAGNTPIQSGSSLILSARNGPHAPMPLTSA